MADREFMEEAEKLGLDIAYLSPERILELIKLALEAPSLIQAIAVDQLNSAGF